MTKSKELEEAIKKSLSNKERGTCIISTEILEILLNYIDNSIFKEVIKEKIEDYKERMRYYQDEHIIVDDEYYRYETKIEELQELLEGR